MAGNFLGQRRAKISLEEANRADNRWMSNRWTSDPKSDGHRFSRLRTGRKFDRRNWRMYRARGELAARSWPRATSRYDARSDIVVSRSDYEDSAPIQGRDTASIEARNLFDPEWILNRSTSGLGTGQSIGPVREKTSKCIKTTRQEGRC
ncbi:hypothetical protein KM043_001833 [Ampulex compressa]|nr:hypothetical protein KM043_001833 [Ampulex compressa]